MRRQLPGPRGDPRAPLVRPRCGRPDRGVPDWMCEAVLSNVGCFASDDGAVGDADLPLAADSLARQAETCRLWHGSVSVLPAERRHERVLSATPKARLDLPGINASDRATQPWNAGQANVGVDTVMDREHRRDRSSTTPDSPVGPVAA